MMGKNPQKRKYSFLIAYFCIGLIIIGILVVSKNVKDLLFTPSYIQKTPIINPSLTLALPVTGDENTPDPQEVTLIPTSTVTPTMVTEDPTLTLTPSMVTEIIPTQTLTDSIPNSELISQTVVPSETSTLSPTNTLAFTSTSTPTITPTLTWTPIPTATYDMTDSATPETTQEGIVWSVDIELPVSNQEINDEGGVANTKNNVEAELDSTIEDNAVTTDVEVSSQTNSFTNLKVTVAGEDGLDQFRETMFGDLNEQIDLMGGAVILDVSGDVVAGQVFPLLLESNPSTGFIWEVDSFDPSKLQLITASEFDQKYNLVGAPSVQTIQFLGKTDGSTTISLFYGRPWLSQSATTHITVDAGSNLTKETLDLSEPVDSSQATSSTGSGLEVVPVDEQSVGTLPPSFDWRSKDSINWLTPVRNQGACGSCWAFSTVGVFESAIKIQGGGNVDLSEQYLVSCNSNGWSCNGGWFANNYHFNRFVSPQTEAGAVLESAFPYTASNSSCSAAYNHPYKLTNWYSIAGDWAVPTVDQIKNTISTYGPVAAAICVGPGFSSYTGGVFTTDEKASCNGGINHAILLTGWDDSTQSWVLRNSWGSYWGESGYMRIRWGISNVGYAANYVVYSPNGNVTQTPTRTNTPINGSTSTPTRTPTNGPSATATMTPSATRTPTLTMTPSPTATLIPVANDNIDAPQQIVLSSVLSFVTSENISNATRAYDDPSFSCINSVGSKSVWFVFTPQLDGLLTVDLMGSNYDTVLGIWQGTRGSLSSIACNDDVAYPANTTSKLNNLQVFRNQKYFIEVASYNSIASGQLSVNIAMKIPSPTSLNASDGTSTSKVDLSWNTVAGSDSYTIFRSSTSSGAKTQLAKVSTFSFSDTTASIGESYTYWVTACVGSNCSDYGSSDTGFRGLEAPVVTATNGTSIDSVNLSWNAILNALTYQVYRTESSTVNPLSGTGLALITINQSTNPTQYKDTSALPGKKYFYWVRACRNINCSNLAGKSVSGWKNLATPVNVKASDNADANKVVITWNAVSGAARYEIYQALSATGSKSMVGSANSALRFEDTSALPGVTYTYFIKGCFDQNCSSFSSGDTGWRSLKVPGNVVASDGTSTTSINLTWVAVQGASSYKLYRSTSSTGTKSLLSTTTTASFGDSSAESGLIYTYWITSCVGANCSNFSAAETGFRSLISPTVVNASDGTNPTSVQINWSTVRNATAYKVHRSATVNGAKTLISTVSLPTYKDTNAAPGYRYFYWITACNGNNCGAFNVYDSGWKGLVAASGFTAIKNNNGVAAGSGSTGVSLTWQQVNGATVYVVYRASSINGTKVNLGSTVATTWTDTVLLSRTYYYFVRACVENRCSPLTSPLIYVAPSVR